jgi:hypothetical protein
MNSDDTQLQPREESSLSTNSESEVGSAATTHFFNLVKQFAGLVGEKGTGAVMFAIGAALIVTVIIGRFVPNSLGANEMVAGVMAGAALLISGSATRLYASQLSMRSAHQTDSLHSRERLEERRIDADIEIAKYKVQGELTDEAGKRHSDERKGEGGTRSSEKNQHGPVD